MVSTEECTFVPDLDALESTDAAYQRQPLRDPRVSRDVFHIAGLTEIVPSWWPRHILPRNMFCPLCQAEYREGFAQCSDCKITLIPSFHDAQHSAALLWDGYRQGVLDTVLTALDEQDVPFHLKEIKEISPQSPWGLQKLLPLPLRLLRVELRSHYEVWVLRADLEKALSAIVSLNIQPVR